MRGRWTFGVVLAGAATLAACAARHVPTETVSDGEPAWSNDEPVPVHELVERPVALDRRAWTPPPAPTLPTTLPKAPAVLPLVRPHAGGDALLLADLALVREDSFDAVAQYRAILQRRPAFSAYVQFRLAQAYLRLGDTERALPLLRTAALAQAPEGWAALTVLAELRTSRIGAVAAVAELRPLAGRRGTDLQIHLVHAAPVAEAAELLMAMAIASPTSVGCGYALAAVQLGHRDDVDELEVDCRAEVKLALGVAGRMDTSNRSSFFTDEFNDAANTWDRLVQSAQAGDLDALPWLDLAATYANARSMALEERHKNLCSYGMYATLSIAADLLARTGQTRGVTADRLLFLADQLEPRFRFEISRTLLRRLDRAPRSRGRR